MIAEQTRSDLDSIANDLGLDSWSYPNKRTVAEAILAERERLESTQEIPEEAPREMPEERLAEESSEEESFEEELEEVPLGILEEAKIEVEKVPPKTVNGLINYFDNYRNTEFKEGVNAQYPKWSDQVKENKDFGDALNQSCQELVAKYDAFVEHTFTKCVTDFQESIQDQVKRNEESAAVFEQSVNHQIANNKDFVTKFYG